MNRCNNVNIGPMIQGVISEGRKQYIHTGFMRMHVTFAFTHLCVCLCVCVCDVWIIEADCWGPEQVSGCCWEHERVSERRGGNWSADLTHRINVLIKEQKTRSEEWPTSGGGGGTEYSTDTKDDQQFDSGI